MSLCYSRKWSCVYWGVAVVADESYFELKSSLDLLVLVVPNYWNEPTKATECVGLHLLSVYDKVYDTAQKSLITN